MLLREKGKRDAAPVSLDWDQAQAALRSGAYEVAEEERAGERGPDQPAAQSPSPGTKPAGEVGDADLDKMTRADLDKLAAERGVDVSKAKSKDDVVALLRASA